jgi:Na+-transporting methylmalonyl-CoA/oxaloacetate decarboxylase gamma subunit
MDEDDKDELAAVFMLRFDGLTFVFLVLIRSVCLYVKVALGRGKK